MHNNFIEHYNYMHALPMPSLRQLHTKKTSLQPQHMYLARSVHTFCRLGGHGQNTAIMYAGIHQALQSGYRKWAGYPLHMAHENRDIG